MDFPAAMRAVLAGDAVRRDAWGPRRAVRLLKAPWNGTDEILAMVDRLNRGDVPPYPYGPRGEDVRGTDWTITTIQERASA
ncbi:Thoeris anti-defense Tad2 family protein [Aureimonas sp. AU40]|uniref:Thoeris anti-defense Tad2 family protein n=1 Tax=Aureimonas sp. AU40 TaxID=1637747 RepID=UPI000785826B